MPGRQMSNIVRQNPIPCALIGLGLGMFIVNRVRNADSRTTRSRSYDMDSETGYGWPHLVMREWPASMRQYEGEQGSEGEYAGASRYYGRRVEGLSR